jgi:hypothetical protein
MRDFRLLPPFLRILSVLGLLFAMIPLIVFIALFIVSLANRLSVNLVNLPPFRLGLPNDAQLSIIAVNILLIGLACSAVVNTYAKRFRQPSQGPFPLTTWRSQARAIALMGALPLCAIILALVISPALTLFGLVFAVSLLGAVVLMAELLNSR